MLNIVKFDAAVLEKSLLKHFPLYYYVKVQTPGMGPYMTLGTLFEQS